MTNYPRETADRFESAARSGQDFTDVYSSIVEMQQSSRDFNSYSRQMFATNMMLQQRGLADFDGDGNQDILLGAKNGMIYTADPTHQVVQARDKNFQVVNQMELPMPPLDFAPRGRTNCFPNHGDRFRERDRDEGWGPDALRRGWGDGEQDHGRHDRWRDGRRDDGWNDAKRDRGWGDGCCPPQCCCCECSQLGSVREPMREGMDTGRSPLSNIYDNGAIYDGMPDAPPPGADTGRSPLSNVYDNNDDFYKQVQFYGTPNNEQVTDYSQFTGDGTMPTGGTVVTDGTVPTDATVPAGTVVTDGTVPTNGTVTPDGTVTNDGTASSDVTVDNGQIPAFSASNDGTVKPYGLTYDGTANGSVTTDGAVTTDGNTTTDGAAATDGSVSTDGTVPLENTVPTDGTASTDAGVPLDGIASTDGSDQAGQAYPIDPNS